MAKQAGKHFNGSEAEQERAAKHAAAVEAAANNPIEPVLPDFNDGVYDPAESKPSADPKVIEIDNEPRKHSHLLSNLLLALGIILMLVAGGMYGMSQWRYHEQDVVNEKLAEYAVVSNEKEASKPPEVDWASLKALNPEVVGWVQIPGTVVNYPVFQASDNDKYLYTNYDGGTNLGGQVFLDYENTAPGMVDGKSIIYGHHLKNGAMFKAVADMDKQAYFDSIETVWYATENETFELEPLFVFYTNPDDGEVRTFKFDTPTALRVHLTDELSRAVAADPLAQGKVDLVTRVMVLSTCNYIDGQGRTILVCGLKSETAPVEIANVVSN